MSFSLLILTGRKLQDDLRGLFSVIMPTGEVLLTKEKLLMIFFYLNVISELKGSQIKLKFFGLNDCFGGR